MMIPMMNSSTPFEKISPAMMSERTPRTSVRIHPIGSLPG
jgi:hypothetical protein